LAERFYERFGAGDMQAAVALFADDCTTFTPSGAFTNEEHEAFGRAFKDALPDARMQVVRAVEAGDEVYITGRFKGTHQGDLVSPQGTIPASGNALDMPFADYFRVRDGRIVEHEVIWDQLAMLGQLGAMPAT
ncbi:MAG: ester cyclase, partial [Acidimicrobiales bacterium]